MLGARFAQNHPLFPLSSHNAGAQDISAGVSPTYSQPHSRETDWIMIQARERVFPGVEKAETMDSPQYDGEVICLQPSGVPTARRRGGNGQGIPELIFLPLPLPLQFISKRGIVTFTPIQSPTWALPRHLGL